MNNVLIAIREGLSRVRKIWIITALVVLGLLLSLAGFASGAVGKVIAAINGKNVVASVSQVVVTPTMSAISGLETPTAMPALPGMSETPVLVPTNSQTVAGSDMDALLAQMQDMMQSLQGMAGQLDQKSAGVLPTATPAAAAVDLQPYMAELQSINQSMVPLMQRIQADLQGNPTAEELASVRAELAQIQGRMANLLSQLQIARNATSYAAAPTMAAMSGLGAMQPTAIWQPGPAIAMDKLDQMMQHMQAMVQQMQGQQQAGNMSSQPGQMDSMMTMMDDMKAKMDNMMGGMSSQHVQMSGMSMATPTPMSGMSGSNSSSGGMMDNMMLMMDNMKQMMNDVMKMEMDMMGMPDR